ncbi:MAG TPA: lipoprotein-releasing ABC transporter ATP-binding protein LolD [Gammaproteobacteria bacterium]|nr:lipoprotein-releasing ABC transporter ATP-binding protein LolD [Gammaproteobacteria bacterium]
MSDHQLPPAVVAQGLKKTFQDDKLKVDVLHGIDMEIAAGEIVAIVGASGSGKSTLLHLLGGLDVPTEGEVAITGQSLTGMSGKKRGRLRNQQVGIVYQFHHLLPEFTALENVCMPLLIGGQSVARATERATELLQRVGLGERLEHKPGELSGGERQRTAIARALANRPGIVLADEPTGNLDQGTAEQIFSLMLELNAESDTAFVIVTHDQALADRMDRVYHLKDGRIVDRVSFSKQD